MKRTMSLPVGRLVCLARGANHVTTPRVKRPSSHTLGSTIGVLLVAAVLSTVSTVARSTPEDSLGVCITGDQHQKANQLSRNASGNKLLCTRRPAPPHNAEYIPTLQDALNEDGIEDAESDAPSLLIRATEQKFSP